MMADLYTPVGIYLRIRDKFPGSVLLESADNKSRENSFSYIAIKPIAGMEINKDQLEYKYPSEKETQAPVKDKNNITGELMDFIRNFKSDGNSPISASESFFGYTAYDAIHFFKGDKLGDRNTKQPEIPLLRYRLYQYVIAINHFKDELYLCENQIEGVESEFDEVETLIRIKAAPAYSFGTTREERSNLTDKEYLAIAQKGIAHCTAKDVAQIVLSRSFDQSFTGDEFNVYRALRSINPSPYLFFFDYGNYKLMGSSPETQLFIEDHKATLSPIAGTVKRTGDKEKDKAAIARLLKDPKENEEHDMLVELATQDMKKHAKNVRVEEVRKVHSYSHVIHLVSKVTGDLPADTNPFDALSANFPAGTLTGFPRDKVLSLIEEYEPTVRGFYGGCIGTVGLNGDFNHAIMIRSFLSRANTLRYQAGAGIIAQSKAESELQEVNNKLNALRQALELAKGL